MQNDLSLGGRRVTGMSYPIADQDGVNKRTLEDMIQAQQLYIDEHFVSADAVSQLRGPMSFNSQRIWNLGDPINNDDAVNLRTVETEISQNNMRELPKYLRLDGSLEPTNDLIMSNFQITNLANPTSPEDATTKIYIDDQFSAPAADAVIRQAGDLDMSQFEIINLKKPKDPQDAVKRRFVEKIFLQKDEDINLENHRITGLTHPSDESDTTSKRYVDREIFRQIDENNRVEAVNFLKADGTSLPEADQGFNGQKIKNLGQPVDPNDAATVNFVDYWISRRTFFVNPEVAQEDLKINNNVISGLANPTKLNDAVHKHYGDS